MNHGGHSDREQTEDERDGLSRHADPVRNPMIGAKIPTSDKTNARMTAKWPISMNIQFLPAMP
jgi:hypothetical protein